ncbi:MAG: glycosyltransferase [Myxococcota bacterium]|nr:glycosyltransferase [Myxococcota bacterium]
MNKISSSSLTIHALSCGGPCTLYRITGPGTHLNQSKRVNYKIFDSLHDDNIEDFLHGADITILQRLPFSNKVAHIFDKLRANRSTIVFEMDDNLLELDKDSPFKNSAPKDYAAQIARSIQECDWLQCSTSPLATSITTLNHQSVVLPNHLLHAPLLHEPPSSTSAPLIIGYGAGQHHHPDWKEVEHSFNLAMSHLEKSGLDFEVWILGDTTIFEAIDTPHKRFFPIAPFAQYLQIIQHFDIALMPLQDTPFNRCKSDLKFLENASFGAACLASPVAYGETIESGVTGIVYQHPDEFQDRLQELALNPSLRRLLGRNAFTYVSDHRTLKHNLTQWIDFYDNCASSP